MRRDAGFALCAAVNDESTGERVHTSGVNVRSNCRSEGVDRVDTGTSAAELTIDEVVTTMLRQNRRWAPVVDNAGYVGLIAVTDISKFPIGKWPSLTARDVARTEIAPAHPDEPVADVEERMRTSHTDAMQ